jgi:hypothetical protein
MKGGTVIRSSQRAATGRERGQLPRNAPSICGVAGKARAEGGLFFAKLLEGEGEREEENRKIGNASGGLVGRRGVV